MFIVFSMLSIFSAFGYMLVTNTDSFAGFEGAHLGIVEITRSVILQIWNLVLGIGTLCHFWHIWIVMQGRNVPWWIIVFFLKQLRHTILSSWYCCPAIVCLSGRKMAWPRYAPKVTGVRPTIWTSYRFSWCTRPLFPSSVSQLIWRCDCSWWGRCRWKSVRV
jgi:hypothetical protein